MKRVLWEVDPLWFSARDSPSVAGHDNDLNDHLWFRPSLQDITKTSTS